MKKSDFYANVTKIVSSPFFPCRFALACLAGALAILISAVLIAGETPTELSDFCFASRILPKLTEAASVSAVFAVVGGAILERIRIDLAK